MAMVLAAAFNSPLQAQTFHRSDINHDTKIDLLDYSLLIFDLLKPPSTSPTDINGDGVVNIFDYSIFINDLQHPDASITPTASPAVSPSAIPTPVSSPLPDSTTIEKKVLMIGFDPTENGTSFAETYFSSAFAGKSVAQIEDDVFQQTAAAFDRLSAGTIRFSLAQKLRITDSPTYSDGFKFSLESYAKCVWGTPSFDPTYCEQRKEQFDYVKWITDEQICEKAAQAGADEIWILSLPYVMRWENFMVGPNPGFNVNSANYTVPSCSKHIIAVNPTYDRPYLVLHDIGHRVESTMEYLTEKWRPEDRSTHWRNFAKFGSPVGSNPMVCGNTHFSFNTATGYDVGNTTQQENSCDDWKNFPIYTGAKTTQNCTAWGCSDAGWQEYWLGRLPRSSGSVELISQTGKPFSFPKNWWKLLLSPDEAIAFYQSIQ